MTDVAGRHWSVELPPELETPCVVIALPILQANITRMARLVADRGIELRPHAKTHNSTRVAELQRQEGAVGLTVSTLQMAADYVRAGFRDLFVAYPVWAVGPRATMLRDLHDATVLAVGVESNDAIELLAAAVAGARRRLDVLIEVDCGERRTGVPPGHAGDVARAAQARGLRVRGVFAHAGHAYARPGLAARAAEDEVRALAQASSAMRSAGIEPEVVSAGSTVTVSRSARPPVTEQRPGTYVFNDRQQVELGSASLDDIALVVAGRVVSHGPPGRFVLDCGARTLAKDRPEWLTGHGILPSRPGARVKSLTDFHAVVEIGDDGSRPRLGEVVSVVPNHVCPVVNLARELVIVQGGQIHDRWAIDARG